MAGYIFALQSKNKKESEIKNVLNKVIQSGVYSTNLNINKEEWNTPQEGTIADFLSMKEGDNVYFFIDRKIYGVGKLVNIKGNCKFLNFPGADIPKAENYELLKPIMILDKKENLKNQIYLYFCASTIFF